MFNTRQYLLYRQVRQDTSDILETEAIATVIGNISKVSDNNFIPIDVPVGRSLIRFTITSYNNLNLQPGYRLVDKLDPTLIYTIAGDPSPVIDSGVYNYSFLAMQETSDPIEVNEALILLTEDDNPILTEDDAYILVEGY